MGTPSYERKADVSPVAGCAVAVAEVETITLLMLAASWPKHCQVPWTPGLQLLRAGTCLVSGAQK